jgi:heme exporter protein B
MSRGNNEAEQMSAFLAILRRDLRVAMKRKVEVLSGLFFYLVVATLFPLAIGSDLDILRKIAPGILWVGALLSSMLTLGRLFEADWQDGTLEQLVLTPQNLSLLVLAKILAHWLLCSLPLVLMSSILGLMFDLPLDYAWVMMATLLLGTPILSCLGAIASALTLGLRGGGVLISLLVLPLYVPVLVFGTGAVESLAAGLGVQAYFSILLAMLLPALFFSPWACAQALKVALE